MTQLPAAPQNSPQGISNALLDDPSDEPALSLHEAVGVLRRNIWLILACGVIAAVAAAAYVRTLPPVYESRATLRIQSKEPNLPEIFKTMSGASEVTSEMSVLSSRTLVEDATEELALQVRVTRPFGASRDKFLRDIQVSPKVAPGDYTLVPYPDGVFEVRNVRAKSVVTRGRPGHRLAFAGVSFVLSDSVASLKTMTIHISSFADAVRATQGQLAVTRVDREGDLLSITNTGQDPALVWAIPNAVVKHFILRREQSEKLQAGSQVSFLRSQIDTLAIQLSEAEERLKNYRERAQVVNPGEEATRQIDRLVELESGRSTLEAERSSLARLLAQVDSQRAVATPGQQSPYRRLLAFPSLLQSQAASQLMNALTQVEEQRVTLLLRRTEQDPEVRRLGTRMQELETDLGSIARTYLQGLTDQVKSRDATIAQFSGQLRSLPGKELQFARLERTPTVLKDMYSLLQTRLKEAEIAEAATSLNVAIVDPAIAPRDPTSPRPRLVIIGALVGGLLIGLSGGVIREFLDHTVRTRADVLAASGLPVLALIPRISRGGRKPALIASQSTKPRRRAILSRPGQVPPKPVVLPPTPERKTFSLWPVTDSSREPTSAPEVAGVPAGPQPGNTPVSETGMTVSGPGSAIAEAYCILQTNVAFAHPGESVKTLVLTSALPGEGKTTTAVNLALALTERGLSVLLVDADMRRGQVAQLFGLVRTPGLCEVLQGTHTFVQARRVVAVGDTRQLTVLTAGSLTSSPPALVSSHGMTELLELAKATYDLIIIDSPPVNILTDAALLGRQADGVVLVVRSGVTDAAALGYAMRQLRHVRAPALGVVLNDIDLDRNGKRDGAYYYAAYASATTVEDEKS